MRGGPLAASTTGRHVALSPLFGGPYLHVNYFIIAIGIVMNLHNIKVNEKELDYICIQHKIVAFIILPHLY